MTIYIKFSVGVTVFHGISIKLTRSAMKRYSEYASFSKVSEKQQVWIKGKLKIKFKKN